MITEISPPLAALSTKKLELLALMLNKKGISGSAAQGIPRRAIHTPAPLSFGQQRLWFLDQLDPDSWVYNIPLAVRITGRLNVPALEQSFDELVRRHESLRTTFRTSNNQPEQEISESQPFELPVIDLGGVPENESEQEIERLIQVALLRPFDLTKGPLMHSELLVLNQEDHVLLLTMHHIVSDGWSMRVFLKELAACYSAFSDGKSPELAELPIQYADYAVWQRQWLQGEVLEKQVLYWEQQLGGNLPVLNLPTDHPRPTMQTYRGAHEPLTLSKEVSESLAQISEQSGATLFMTLLAAFKVLLCRYSGQEDVIVGTPIAGRNRADLEGLVGFFVNTLVMRTDLKGNPSFQEVIARVRASCLAAYEHQDLPFEELVDTLQPERDASRTPLFQVMFTLENAAAAKGIGLEGLQFEPLSMVSETAKFDLTLSITEGVQGLFGALDYNTDLFEAATIRRMVEHFKVLLEGLTHNPHACILDLPLLTLSEQQLLVEWNETERGYPGGSIGELFEAQVAATPEAVALVFGTEQVSYGELNRRANQLAHYLRQQGVGREVLVGVMLERSIELVVSLLGILKAGGAYVPLDAQYPAERLAFMIEDAALSVLLTTEQLSGGLPSGSGSEVICLERSGEQIGAQSEENGEPQSQAEDLAYVIYTSGSTGIPKGVAVPQRAVIRLVKENDYVEFNGGEVFLQLAPVSFDASTFEIWGSLLNGARLIMMPPESPTLAELGEALRVHGVTTLWLSAGLFHLMVDERLAELGGVRQLLSGGDVIGASQVERYLAGAGIEAVLINGYGPTENTTFSCSYGMRAGWQAGGRSVPIGQPIANTQAYVLDERLARVPIGVEGELYLGGAGLAREYLRRPELTAERFVPHPYSAAGGARLYRTGDLVRWLGAGQLEFVGRRDQQVKIRGFRVELGEIETVLRGHQSVRETVVMARADEAGERRLVAYLVGEEGETSSSAEWRAYLRERLPDYMVPSVFVMLERLPLTANGKVDRRALPRPEQAVGEQYQGPRTPVEELLCGIWADVLKVEQVGVYDNFFDLGGHSLLATQLISRVREAFAVELPLRTLFEAPSVAGLAASVEQERRAGQSLRAPAIRVLARDSRLPLSFAQQRLWFLEQLNPGSAAYNVPVAVRLKGELDVGALERSLTEIVRRHESLRTTFIEVEGEPQQLISEPQLVRLPVTDLSQMGEVEREAEGQRLIKEEAGLAFDLTRGPVVRAALLKLGAAEQIALFTVHHIVSDGWSMGVLIRELSALYESYAQGREAELPELGIQYADYAGWQREWLQGEVLAEQLGYWKAQLGGELPVLELPTDHPRPAVQGHQGASRPLKLSAETSGQLRELSRREGVTLFMTLLAGLNLLLGRYTGQEDIVIGTPIAGRNRLETEGLIGFFVNTLALRTDLRGDPTFTELMHRVREVALESHLHQDLPFEKLVEELQPARDLSHTPVFQVMFALQNAPGSELKLGDLQLRQEAIEIETAKFDLTLVLEESGGVVQGALNYNTELFEAATIERLLRHLERLLTEVAVEPGQRLSQLQLLSEAEEQQLLVAWNETERGYPGGSIGELFEAQVAATPEAVALVFGTEQVSYGELNRRANQLAHYLRQQGVGREVLVGVMLERSIELVVSLLGILKAGGAYVPLDAQYPAERLAFMIEDAALSVLLTTEQLSGGLPSGSGSEVICLERSGEQIGAQSEENGEPQSQAEDLAYVIYTSGSTGIPKGVAVPQRAVIRLVFNTNFVQLNSSDRIAQASNASFDALTFELWGALLHGGQLIGISKELALSPQEFGREIEQRRISVMFLTTALFNQMARSAPQAFASLRYLLFGGETVDPHWVREVLAEGKPEHLLHVYGPTENTTFSTWYAVESVAAEATVPIGGPIMNTQVYVLDENKQVVPIGVVGELYLGGAGLAREYLRRPELTAERFVPHPYSAAGGARLYRTGDLVRWLGAGQLEFVGRRDQQVKIRGFRVELSEIETVLDEYWGVFEAVVIARQESSDLKRLVAYVVPEEGVEPTAQEMHAFLKEKLPDYMLPSAFILLSSLPLTPNGKLDLKALPEPEFSKRDLVELYVAPRTQTEELLAGLWADLLKVEQVGIYDNFFELGGHSLLATQVVSRVREAFRMDLPLRRLFESPTVATLAETIEETLRKTQRIEVPPIELVSREQPLALSFAQQRLWFLEQLNPGSAAYNVPVAVRLKGELDVGALERSLTEIVRRHESLRTTFIEVEGEPQQLISEPQLVRLPVTDLSQMGEVEREAEGQRLIKEEAGLAFDLRRGPVVRAALLKLGAAEQIALFTVHHIVSDGWSMGVLIRELSALYESYAQGREAELPELGIQYADYAGWQREWLQGEVLAEQLGYWKAQLGGELPVLELPTDHPRPAFQTFQGATESLRLSTATTQALKELSRREGVTLFMTLLAALNLLLARYTGQEDIVIGTPLAGRNRLETEGLIGLFVNTLALRTDLSGDPTFRELLVRVREMTLHAYQHQDLPFEKLVEELRPKRDLSRTPVFQVMFVLQNTSEEKIGLKGLEVGLVESDNLLAKFDLTLGIAEKDGRIVGSLGYNTGLFEAAGINRMVRSLEQLLGQIVATPQQRLSELQVISAEEQQLLVAWNETEREYPGGSIGELFEAQVAATPEAVALVFGTEQVSYGELNRRANQLAHYLRQQGVGREVLVGVMLERSIELVVSLLGILKAGGAYVPLDAQYPAERLAFMIEDAALSVLLTTEQLSGGLPSGSGSEVICLERSGEQIGAQSEENGEPQSQAEDLAYVIYTSGSTGIPKGVAVPQRAVIRLVKENDYVEFNGGEVFLQLAPVSFDASTFEIWGSLLNGARLIMMPPESPTLAELGEALRVHGVTTLWLSAGLFHLMVDERLAELGGVRQLLTGGDVIGAAQVERYLAGAGSEAVLINGYGPTENTTFSCSYGMRAGWQAGGRSVPIGQPIANTQAYVLDERLARVPIGVEGELYLGGAGLAREYLRRPELTAERFVPHPYSAAGGARLYRTGDLVRWLGAGQLEFVGRRDQQVKIRGFRVELSEIETVLDEYWGVFEAVVIARQESSDLKRLVAYVVPEEGVEPTAQEMHAFLKEKLPDYMLPSAFILLSSLPLTPNGKLDLKALPEPEFSKRDLVELYVAPRTQTEELLAGLWADLLKVEQVGIYDNFFELGGHSLLATQVVSRVREAFRMDLPLRRLFESPTVATLAETIEETLRKTQRIEVPPIELVSREQPLALSFAQQRLWFLEQLNPGSAAYNVPVAVRLKGELDVEALERSLTEIVRRHESLRTTFIEVEGEPQQLISEPQLVRLPVTDLSQMGEVEREAEGQRLIKEEAGLAFDLRRGPVVRAALLKLGAAEQIALFTVHHIVSDGWSMGVLIRELSALYESYAQGREAELPELGIQYADYAGWQREWLQGAVLAEQLGYWKAQLGGELPVLELPTDHPRPAVQGHQGASRPLKLSAETSGQLRELSRREGVTLFMTLLAGLNLLLARYTGQEDIVIGTPIAGRNRLETEGLIGFFVNTLALRTDLRGDPTFTELMHRVREVALESHLHQDLPFEKLVEELQPARDLSHTPVFQVMFALQNAPGSELKLGDLQLRQEAIEIETAKFDLTLVLEESGGVVQGALNYNTELFEPATIERLLRHLERLLTEVAVEPGQRLSQLQLLSEAEEQQLLVAWNETERGYPGGSIGELFEAQVAATPEAVALVFGTEQVSYGELNRRANQLAHYLRQQGVGREVLVGVMLERSIELVVSLLGILKAGGAYVPLDAQYPAERLAFMIEDAALSVLLTTEQLSGGLPSGSGSEVICLERSGEQIGAQSEENGEPQSQAEDLAYVIYTSGSTGIPKGVAVPQRAVIRLVFNTNFVQLNSSDRIAQASNASFDALTFELWGALLHGGQLIGISKELALSPQEFGREIEQRRISVMFLTTALFNQMARSAPQAFASLRYLLFGGETVDPHWVREVLAEGKPEHLLHVYGPTENTTFSTWYAVESVAAEATVPIGGPIMNTQVYVLDENKQVVPIGVVGELYLGGAGLAREYLRRPELTAERFVPHPYSAAGGARLYRTGDLVRWLGAGQLEFVGRRDQQVKIRGFRVELSEIETVLDEYWGVFEAVVIARQESSDLKRLVAYVVPEEGVEPTAQEMHAFLKEKLPDYMLPSAFILLSSLPLTPNGKLDLKALPEPEFSKRDLVELYVAPRTQTEELLAGLWADLLKVEQVGIYDNFFELGGHSLLATQVVSRVREAFRMDLPLRRLFESPTVATLAETIEETLRKTQRIEVPPIELVSREQPLALSFAQQRLWFLEQLNPGSAAYNVPVAVRLKGELDVGALERSLTEIVRRHESLRTTFIEVEGEPQQLISEPQLVRLPVTDLSQMGEVEREAEGQRLIKEEAGLAFDLRRGPVVRAALLKLGAAEQIALFTVHHIVSDGWSMGVLIRELSALYESYAQGREAELPELGIQYADYAGWQREWLQGEVLAEQLGYWKAQLGGELPVLELPTDHPRPAVQGHQGASRPLKLSAETSGQLRELSRREGVTLFMTLLAGLNLLLARYTGQEDIVIGTPIAGRNRLETEGLIGFFVNTLALRTDLRGDPTFTELMHRVREVALESHLHQDLPFEKLVEELQPARDLSHTPVFQVMFALQNAPGSELKLGDLQLRQEAIEIETAKFDLTLVLEESGGVVQGALNYNTELFEAATIERLLAHFQQLLTEVTGNPESRLSQLRFTIPVEEQELLVAWNETEREYPGGSIGELFEAQVAAAPEAVALVFGAEQVSYGELNRRANQLAHYLRQQGVGREVLVGVMLERSIELVVSLLGILKAGGAYVPLDPTYPPGRLSFMLEDAGLSILLTQQHLLEKVPAPHLKAVCLDADWAEIACLPEANLETETTADNLAYVIYTSGSTGRPKGVLVQHGGVGNLAFAVAEAFGVSAQSRVLQFASISFDASVVEIFKSLLNGATLCLSTAEWLLPVAPLVGLLREQRITMVTLPPSVWAVLPREDLPELRTVISAGEACAAELAASWSGAGRRFVNAYGPTEVTVCATISEAQDGSCKPPIGRPIANTEVYVLDRNQQPVPIGVLGELYVGGVGLARGYRGQPELTAERFVPNPFSAAAGKRLYRTGDLARYWADGNLEYLGRMDQQVKIRGFRIELGEIQAVLNQYWGISESVVVTSDSLGRGAQLIAYVVAEEGIAPTPREMTAYLQNKLPAYMLPSVFVMLAELPLTPNGKVDRRALPAPQMGKRDLEQDYMAPRTPIEELLAEIWADVLKVERVGIYDNFFDLGGHSLLATQVVSRLRKAFKLELGVRQLFESPTITRLAEAIEESVLAGRGLKGLPIEKARRDEPLPMSFAQQRLWFIDQFNPGSAAYNVPMALRLQGGVDVNALEQTLTEMSRRHEVLRTVFAVEADQPVQIIRPATKLKIALIDLTKLDESEREAAAIKLVDEEGKLPMDLANGPLFRFILLRLGTEDHIAVLTMHHIISDAWSIGVFQREFATLYEAFSKGEESPLAELPIQYADYAAWQRKWLQGEVLEEQLQYWRQQMEAAPPMLALPTDRPRPTIQSHRGATQSINLSPELSKQLKQLGRGEGVTLFMTLLAGFETLLRRYSGQEDIVVGTPIAGRNRMETEGLIGFFVNTQVLRTDLSGDPTFRELLARVREVALGAYENQDLPFEKLVDALQPERTRSRSPLFQILFALQNAPTHATKLSDLAVIPLPVESGIVKFDLSMIMEESERGLAASLRYNTDLFNDSTVIRFLARFQLLLEEIVAEPDKRISRLALLSLSESSQLIGQGVPTSTAFAAEQCVHELFEAEVARMPEATALVFEDQQLTYRELNARANQVAHHLRGLGVGPEVIVGICLERSSEMVVAVLGVLKAGGAYVPLEPANPSKRLAFMIEDAGLDLLLTQQSLLATLPTHGAQLVCLDADWENIRRESEQNPISGAISENAAYVIYTSGSTGEPKGVVVTHANVTRLFTSTHEWYHFEAQDVWTMFHSFAFDFSVWELWGALLYGGRLVIVPYLVSRSPEAFYELLVREKVSVLNQTPSAFRQLIQVEQLSPSALALQLRLIIFGGEALEMQSLHPWFVSHGDKQPRLVNMYGITETTVHVTYRPLAGADLTESRGSLIGGPIADLGIYALDQHLQLVPIGVVGELYVSGAGLARNYLNRPSLTAQHFLPNPFSNQPGQRLYKTGDQVRFQADGEIEYLGRMDQQVKIRGFRIELGEIESVLGQHEEVREVVVLAREDGGGDKRLVAYLVTEVGARADVSQWRAWLSERLPEYMIPAVFVLLAEFPMTLNGKVDRGALPAPDGRRPEQGQAYLGARDQLEQMLVEMWKSTLGLEQVGVTDNFFDLGGDSIKGAILINQLQRQLAEYVYVVAIFDAPTVAELAAYLRQHYPAAVNRICDSPAPAPTASTTPINMEQMAKFRQLIPALPAPQTRPAMAAQNPPALAKFPRN